jgi:hypothetical protein
MTDNIPDTADDEQSMGLSEASRREYLRSMAVAPVTLALLDDRKETLSRNEPLATAAAVPEAFTSYDVGDPTPFARRLMARDDRFEEHQFSARGFVEGLDDANPRYVVSTGCVTLHDPSDASVVRRLMSEMFEEYMDRLYDRTGGEWTDASPADYDAADVHRNAVIHFDAISTAGIDWLDPDTSAQGSEHWVLDTTDREAVLTVVFGSRQGPWRPQTLLDRARADALRGADR